MLRTCNSRGATCSGTTPSFLFCPYTDFQTPLAKSKFQTWKWHTNTYHYFPKISNKFQSHPPIHFVSRASKTLPKSVPISSSSYLSIPSSSLRYINARLYYAIPKFRQIRPDETLDFSLFLSIFIFVSTICSIKMRKGTKRKASQKEEAAEKINNQAATRAKRTRVPKPDSGPPVYFDEKRNLVLPSL